MSGYFKYVLLIHSNHTSDTRSLIEYYLVLTKHQSILTFSFQISQTPHFIEASHHFFIVKFLMFLAQTNLDMKIEITRSDFIFLKQVDCNFNTEYLYLLSTSRANLKESKLLSY